MIEILIIITLHTSGAAKYTRFFAFLTHQVFILSFRFVVLLEQNYAEDVAKL